MKPTESQKGIIDEMSTSIYLGPDCEKLNQFVYASQLYGTFFCVYGIFEASDAEGDKKRIDKITLNILNYKGNLNLGLEKAYYDKDKKTIILHVKGMTDPENLVEVDFNGRNIIVEKGDELKLYRELDRLSSAESDTDKYFVFDSEYYARDGELMIPRIRYEQLKEKEIKENLTANINFGYIKEQGNDITGRLSDIELFAPGRRCVPTTMIVRF